MSIKGINLEKASQVVNVPEFTVLSKNEPISFYAEYYAVRSSAEDEDQKGTAGKHKTFLFVTKEDLSSRIEEVINECEETIVQKQINSDFSGVAILSKNNESIFIAEGLCEGITSGKIMTYEYKLEKNELIYQKPFFEVTPQKIIFEKDVGLVIKNATIPSFSKQNKEDLIIMIKTLKYVFQENIQIEFTFKNNILYCLQVKNFRGGE
jgi:phosphoenolpyruvate synthase/pyruvate phosphate dikinase